MTPSDAQLTVAEALAGVAPECPDEILNAQVLVDVTYPGVNLELRRGQIVVHRDLAEDVADAFQLFCSLGFPIGSAIPLAVERFADNGAWSDDLSMAANNSSAFNYRTIAGTDRLSHHATGRALDINPLWNPMYLGETPYPPEGVYDLDRPGTLHAGHPIVSWFEERGWEWGGHWESPWDLHHFQNP